MAGAFVLGSGGINCNLFNCNFINNKASNGGAIVWDGANSNLTDSTFSGNTATSSGGGIYWSKAGGIIQNCIFINNTAGWGAGAIQWYAIGTMNNCNFVNSKWINNNSRFNGIYIEKNLTINGGKGIVDIRTGGTLSGISIVVLNNETYYYPPNTNINFVNNVLNYA